MAQLATYTQRLAKPFSELSDWRKAHHEAAPILQSLAEDPEAFADVVRKNFLAPCFFSRPHTNPVFNFPVYEDANISLNIHAWIPRLDAEMTHQSIHHHGNLCLTTYSSFGEGYRSVLFKPGFTVNPETNEANLQVDKFYRNPKGCLEFVDTQTPHVVVLPTTLTLTWALWSLHAPSKVGGLKQHPLIQRNKKLLGKAVTALGLRKTLGLNQVQGFDFYTAGGKAYNLPKRVLYPNGALAVRARNGFYTLQQMAYDDAWLFAKLPSVLSAEEKTFVEPLLQDYLAGTPIEPALDANHHYVDRVTIPLNELVAAFPVLKAGATAPV